MKLFQDFGEEKEGAGFKAAISVLLISFLLRLCYMNFICLLPEEAYYWKYATHLDLGYLDHPPMVALTIFLGTKILGVSEFALRIGALLWWLLGAVFVYLLTKDIFDKRTGHAALLLYSVLPYFFGTGFFITPDSPLLAFWAGALFFIQRALVQDRRSAWWGLGLCTGLGMLSKYSIALLGPAVLVYILCDKKSRSVLLGFRPYLAAIAALLLFSPVLIWNKEHEWASFAFQSADRLTKPFEFSLHALLGHMFIILTPIGFYVFALALWSLMRRKESPFAAAGREQNLFLWVFTLVPLFVFVFFSLSHEVKINWTGPVFLAFLPLFGRSLVVGVVEGKGFVAKGWQWTAALLLVCYAIALQYLSFGIPGVPYSARMYKVFTGTALAERVLALEDSVTRWEGVPPVVVGMDKHYLASQLGFYREKIKGQSAVAETAGRSLFGMQSLMYRFWTRPQNYEGRTMILVSRTPNDLDLGRLRLYFRSVGNMQDIETRKRDYVVGRFYYRVASGYRNDAGKAAQ